MIINVISKGIEKRNSDKLFKTAPFTFFLSTYISSPNIRKYKPVRLNLKCMLKCQQNQF